VCVLSVIGTNSIEHMLRLPMMISFTRCDYIMSST